MKIFQFSNCPLIIWKIGFLINIINCSQSDDKSLAIYSDSNRRVARDMDDEHYFEMHSDHDHQQMDQSKMMMEQKKESRKTDNWGSQYYDLLINEGSYKFWAVFQVVTAVLLIYSAFAAIYYAKFNLVTADYDYNDFYDSRSFDSAPANKTPWLGISSQTFQTILNAISSKKYS